jgi:hypothetical protein
MGPGPRPTDGAAGREGRERLARPPPSKVGDRLHRFFGRLFWVIKESRLCPALSPFPSVTAEPPAAGLRRRSAANLRRRF